MDRSGTDVGFWERAVPGVRWRLGGLGLVAVLGVAVLGVAAGGPEWLVAGVVTAVLLLVTGVAIVGGFVYLVSGIAAVHRGMLPLPEGTPIRAESWYPVSYAIFDQLSLLGAGLVDSGDIIAPYRRGASSSPHNSYLTILIRAGFLGGIAYGILIGSCLLAPLLNDRDVDFGACNGVLALGVGFAAHQMFEAYTSFNWSHSSVLVSFVLGSTSLGTRIGLKSSFQRNNYRGREGSQPWHSPIEKVISTVYE